MLRTVCVTQCSSFRTTTTTSSMVAGVVRRLPTHCVNRIAPLSSAGAALRRSFCRWRLWGTPQRAQHSLLPPRSWSMMTANARTNSTDRTMARTRAEQFRFEDYDIIGFDLDATLLRYRIDEMVPLVHRCLQRFLVDEKHYPRRLLGMPCDMDFMQKGLIIDDVHGNVVKLGADAEILRASHGTRALTAAQIAECYGAERQWSVATQFCANPLSTWNSPLEQQIRALLDCFDMAAALNFAQAIDVIDAQQQQQQHRQRRRRPYLVWPDVLAGLVRIYARENFSNGRSEYFKALRDEPSRYLWRNNGDIVQLLQDLRLRGKQIFLLTGSNVDFANLTASYAFDSPDWQSLFDCVICYARKPGFFTGQRPFLGVRALQEVRGSELPLSHNLPLHRTYSQGNWTQLRDTLAARLGKAGDEVRCLYVGDNLVQDVYTPVTHHRVDALAVCEELLTEECAASSSSRWGSYFCVDNKATLWASIIANYSRLCVPAVNAVADAAAHAIKLQQNCYQPSSPKL